MISLEWVLCLVCSLRVAVPVLAHAQISHPQGSDFVMSSPAFPVTSYLPSALCVLPVPTLPGGLRATPGPGTPPGGLMRLFARQILVKLQLCASFVPGTGGAIMSDTGRWPASVESSFHGVGT